MNKKAAKVETGPAYEIPNAPTLERTAPEVITLRFPEVAAGFEQWVMLSSDHHWDNPLCDRALLKSHLDKAKERDALIFVFGDLFCAMQGRHDPRRAPEDVRAEHIPKDHHGPSYLDLLASTAADFYGPYAKNIALMSEGNHEAGVRKNCNVSLLSNLAHRLNSDYGGQVTAGPYAGWVRYMAHVNGTKIYSRSLKYHHGAGGDAPVTKGTIQTNRQAVYLPDADVVVNGHSHNAYVLPIARERLSSVSGLPYRDLLWFVRTPGYKQEYGTGGYADMGWQPPKPMGCVWLKLTCGFTQTVKGKRVIGAQPLGMELIAEVV